MTVAHIIEGGAARARRDRSLRGLLGAGLLAAGAIAGAAPDRVTDRATWLQPCRLAGVAHAALCGTLARPLDPQAPQGASITLHVAVVPALARHRRADPLLLLAGGPGQSAIDLAGPMSARLARLLQRRDLVLVDQRGTGRSAPLHCADAGPSTPLAEQFDAARQRARLADCRVALERLPHGDLRRYTTAIAAQDLEAVRQALGVAQWNLLAVSYGTRVALELMRQQPRSVRRAVLDGVVPPDRALAASASADAQAALDGVLAACEADRRCAARHPALRRGWQALLAGLPRPWTVVHPLTGATERIVVTREVVLGLVRQALYLPTLGSALPEALSAAAVGRLEPLAALAAALPGGARGRDGQPALARGMHFSVACSEDAPLLAQPDEAPGRDFGDAPATIYRAVCADWPRGEVPAGFREVAPAPAAVLLLSGALDPATPPRHGEAVARALGQRARHVVAEGAGHGVLSLPCAGDVLRDFVEADGDAAALAVDAGCLLRPPPPLPFVPPWPAATPGGGAP